jgi:malonyl-CoA/methylmalonyl-CoA synthetase
MLDGFQPGPVIAELSRGAGPDPCTVVMAVPAMYTRLMDHLGDRRPDFGHLRLVTSGSAPLPEREFGRITRVFGREPVEREGMSETGMNFSNPLKGRRVPGSIGRPLPGVSVRVVDPETLQDAAAGKVGEIWLKSGAISPGYWRKPKESAEAFHEGWFRTGDLGRVDAGGYYYLTDRLKHIIISGGENISAREVETVIDRMAGVLESAVVGIPDDRWGEKVVAAVRRRPGDGPDPDAVLAFCRRHLHDWKCPKEIVFVDEIPRNTMGKVLKDAVKGYFTHRSSAEPLK